jgi:hypothetical protein
MFGAFFATMASELPVKPGQAPPPEFMGWIFAAVGTSIR